LHNAIIDCGNAITKVITDALEVFIKVDLKGDDQSYTHSSEESHSAHMVSGQIESPNQLGAAVDEDHRIQVDHT